MSFNLLEQSTNFIDFAVEKLGMINLDWIGKIVQWIVSGVGIVGVGVILFTLILKTVVLPLDVYSRVKMKKQSLLMKKMRPQMEKLQQQYSNDKTMYNQKVMELQKENGVSMFGACIPMIVTLLIFLFVFQAFSTYSQYANLSTYNDMVDSYNSSVQTFVMTDIDGVSKNNENGFLIEKEDESIGQISYLVDFDEFAKFIKNGEGFDSEYFRGIYAKLKGIETLPDNLNIEEEFGGLTQDGKMFFVRYYVKENARKAAADYYRQNTGDQHFIWVGNIWYPDSMLNKETPDFSGFKNSVSRALSGSSESYEASYNEVTYYLRNAGYLKEGATKVEGERFNGYFVLIILAIGLMFLQQFISMRSQKDANELGTVDGSAAKTNKWMLIMMPVIYGAFSFLYSAAFSIYMITNTLYGLITTLIINKAMDVSFAKQEANGGYNAGKKAKLAQNNRKRLK